MSNEPKKQPRICISLPGPIMEWMKAEAEAMDMGVSAFIAFHLSLARTSRLEPELRALRVRVEAIERELQSQKEWPENPESIAPAPVKGEA